eukprot:g9278.t1
MQERAGAEVLHNDASFCPAVAAEVAAVAAEVQVVEVLEDDLKAGRRPNSVVRCHGGASWRRTMGVGVAGVLD